MDENMNGTASGEAMSPNPEVSSQPAAPAVEAAGVAAATSVESVEAAAAPAEAAVAAPAAAPELSRKEKKQLKKEQSKREKPGGGQKALQKKLAATEREIAALEERLKELEAAIDANATDYEALGRLFEEKAAAEAEIEGKYEDWGALSEELEGSS